jgi:hypothetical protein
MLSKAFVRLYGLLIVVAVRVALTVFSYSTFCTCMERAQSWRPPLAAGALASPNIRSAVLFGARFVPRSTCLVKCRAAQLLYAWSGKAAILRVGVARSATSELSAHSWLEVEGVNVFDERGANGFTELKEYLA